jgi:hypothetical protein
LQAKKALKKKDVRCKFCDEDVLSKNFIRHIERHHGSEKEIEDILKLPKNSKDRRLAFILLRKDTNFQLHISGTTRPFRKSNEEFLVKFEYYPCIYCKGLFKKQYLRRHAKKSISKPNTSEQIRSRMDHVSNSQTFVACASDPTDTISKLNVKCQVRVILKFARENKLIRYQKLTQQIFLVCVYFVQQLIFFFLQSKEGI